MRKPLLAIVAFVLALLPCAAHAQLAAYNGLCTSGATNAVVQGMQSSNTLAGVVPGCTVTVYIHGGSTLATLYNNQGQSLANPFTAGSNGLYSFYVLGNNTFDVQVSGAGLQTTITQNVFPAGLAQSSAAFATPEQFGAKRDGVTNDYAALQACMNTPTGICVGSKGTYLYSGAALTIPPHLTMMGAGMVNGTILKCEFNGDCFNIATGPVQGVHLSDFDLVVDPTLANSRGFHFNAAPLASVGYVGGLWNSQLQNIEIDTPALEGVWLDGGNLSSPANGGLPNQFVEFDSLNINGAPQNHPQPLFRATGQDAQTDCVHCSIGGDAGNLAYYPVLIYLGSYTSGQNDAPGTIHFIQSTTQGGTIGVETLQSKSDTYVFGDMEDVSIPFETNFTNQFVVKGNQFRNSGNGKAILYSLGSTFASIEDNDIEVSSASNEPPYLCLGINGNSIRMSNNSANYTVEIPSAGCSTVQAVPAATLTIAARTAFMNPGTTPIQTLNSPITAGESVTLYASGTFYLGSGGNIVLGSLYDATPYNGANFQTLTVNTGESVTLTKLDLGPTYIVQSVNHTQGVTVPAPQLELSDTAGGSWQWVDSSGVLYLIHTASGGTTHNMFQVLNGATGQMTFAADGSMSYTGSASFANLSTAGMMTAASISVSGAISANTATIGSLNTTGNITANGSISAVGSITAANFVQAGSSVSTTCTISGYVTMVYNGSTVHLATCQ